jgi:hypothetical protein
MASIIDQVFLATQAKNDNNSLSIALLCYCFIDAQMTLSKAAIVHAKNLSQNADAQNSLNEQAKELKWYNIFDIQPDHHKITTKTAHTDPFGSQGNDYVYYTYKVQWVTTINAQAQEELQNAQAKNQSVVTQRAIITDKINLLEQEASVEEDNTNALVDECTKIQEANTSVMKDIQNLTYLALIRDPPS